MTKVKRGQGGQKGMSGTNKGLLIGGAALGLYLITRPGAAIPSAVPPGVTNIFGGTGGTGGIGEQGPQGPPGPSTLQKFTDIITGGVASTATGIAEVPAAIFIGIPKKMILESEERTSTEIFGGETKKDVSTFMGTYPAGSRMTGTYKQFIQEQPLAFRAAAGVGNIITGQEAAKYGKYVAEETKKGQIVSLGPGADVNYAQRFSQMGVLQQVAVSLGQMATVPLGGGGASGWGAATKKEWTKELTTNPFAIQMGILRSAFPTIVKPAEFTFGLFK